MIVMFRDQEDNSLFVEAVESVLYDSDTESMLFYGREDEIVVAGITQKTSDTLVQMLFLEKRLNMTNYPAQLNPEEE